MTITFIGTPITPGMNTFTHNAFGKKGVQERFVWIVLKNPLLPGDSIKRWPDFSEGRPPIHLPYPIASPAPAFRCKTDAKYPL